MPECDEGIEVTQQRPVVLGRLREAEAGVEHQLLHTGVQSGVAPGRELVADLGHDVVVCVHPGWPMLRGRGRVLRSFSAIMANTPYIQFFLTDVHVAVMGDTAVVTCTENILTPGDEPTAGFHGGKAQALNVFTREQDGWRLWIHQASPVGSAGI